ncbi:hypothetical protein N7513_005819 [Penicillium frequentans]|nr:hypothetical protein N7513_005819 [Penicillium glabrum]
MQTPSLNIEEMNPIPRSSGSEFPTGGPTRTLSLGVRSGPGHQPKRTVLHEGTALTPRLEETADPDEQAMSTEEAEAILNRGASDNAEQDGRGRSVSGPASSYAGMTGLGISRAYSPAQRGRLRSTSVLSLDQIRSTRQSFTLENADPTFKDETGKYSRYFQGLLQRLNGKNSESDLCIEDFIVQSEKEWSRITQPVTHAVADALAIVGSSQLPLPQ